MASGSISRSTDRPKTAARGYGGRWQRERLAFLNANPLCVMCQALGIITAASVVDHKVPHKGDPILMWDWSNWQALCKPHHDRDKQAMDRGSAPKASTPVGIDGRPTSASHPWNRA